MFFLSLFIQLSRNKEHYLLHIATVNMVKSAQFGRIHIQNAHDTAVRPMHRNNYFGTAKGRTDYVTWKLFHIRNNYSLVPFPCRTAHASTFIYMETSHRSLKRPYCQHAVTHKIESCPQPTGKRLRHCRRDIRQHRRLVSLAGDERLNLSQKPFVDALFAVFHTFTLSKGSVWIEDCRHIVGQTDEIAD